MKKIIAFLLMMLIAFVCSNGAYAFDPATKSSKQRYNERVIGSLAEQLRAAVAYNATHAQKKYYIRDNDNARFFYSFFTSDNASDLIDEDYKKMKMSHEYDWNINRYILKLRDKYLPKKYEDYQIYFMVGGLFYTPDIKQSRYEEKLDWKTLRSVSFENVQATNPVVPYATDPAKEQVINSEFSKKVNRAIYDTVLKENDASIVITDKTIIIFRWLLFDFDIKDETLESYLKELKVDLGSGKMPQPVLFMSDGFFYKKKTDELAELEAFLESDGDYSDIISLDNMAYQRNKLFKDITNAFVYFYQKEKPLIPDDLCNRSDEEKEKILGVLASSYRQAPTGNWSNIPFRNPVLFSNINWDTRKCVIGYLLNKQNCNDAKGWWVNNSCENMLLDVIEATKGDDQKKLLEYFNDPVNYKKVCEKIDDLNGDDNFTLIIYSFVRLAALNGYRDPTKNQISDALFDFYHMVKRDGFTNLKTELTASVDTSNLKFSITQSSSVFIGEAVSYIPISESAEVFTCTPFTPINFIYSDDLGVAVQKPDGTTPVPGEIVSVPALYLQWLIDKNSKMHVIKVVNTTLMVYGLITGTTELAAATTAGARLWEFANVFFSMAGLLSNSADFRAYVKDQWGNPGMEVLATINTLGGWYGKACLGKSAFQYLQAKVKQQAFQSVFNQMKKDPKWISLFSERKGEIDAAVAELGKGLSSGIANDAVNNTVGDLVNNTEKEKIFVRIDTLGLIHLINTAQRFDEETRKKFIVDFSGASDAALKKLNENLSLVDYWQEHGDEIKKRVYPDVGHKDWKETKMNIVERRDPVDNKILTAIESARPPSNSEIALAGAYSPDLEDGTVAIAYNVKTFNVTTLEKELQDPLDYLVFIKEDYDKGGKLYQTLYSNVPWKKIENAGIPGAHAEVLAVNEIVKLLKKANKFHSISDLGKIHVLVKGISKYGNMCRCPHCFQILYDVIMIGNQ
jgi:hypothetical protein